jgi:hypothetical protein
MNADEERIKCLKLFLKRRRRSVKRIDIYHIRTERTVFNPTDLSLVISAAFIP